MFEQTDEREPESAGRLASLDHVNYRPRYPKRYLLLEPALFYNRGMADRKMDDSKMKRLDLSVINFSVSTRSALNYRM